MIGPNLKYTPRVATLNYDNDFLEQDFIAKLFYIYFNEKENSKSVKKI